MKHLSTIKTMALAAMLTLSAHVANAQCSFTNTAFTSGENLTYNLYYNWKFVWVKAGTASMTTVGTVYQGKKAYRASLTTRGNSKADGLYVLRDTLLCYTTDDLVPLYFRKGAKEGKRYTVDEVFYSYPSGKCHTKQHRRRADGTHHWEQHTWNDCVYDMLSIFLRARSFNPSNWKKGHVINFPIVDGNSREKAQLRYSGTTTVKADNGKKYECLQLSYMELSSGRYKEIVRFYVTNDSRHIPIRLDLFLRFGTAKAFLVSMNGTK